MTTASSAGGVDGHSPTHRRTSFETMSPRDEASSDDVDKPKISFILTMFNILCSSVGIGVLFLPTTLCGAGIPLGIASILLIGLAADWSSRALVEATCKSKSKSLEEMFQTVLGHWASHVYSISVFFLLIGALSIFIIMMGMQTNDVYLAYYDITDSEEMKREQFHFRILALCFSVLCGLSLFIRNLKMLSYVSIIKIVVIVVVLLISVAFAPGEYFRRRVVGEKTIHGEDYELRSFAQEFPLWPTLLGFMKAMGSWQTAYLFHMGVSDMYFSLQNRSYAKWSRVSRLSVTLIATLNVCYAMVGYLATADQLHAQRGDLDLCEKGVIFLSLYNTDGPLKNALIMAARGTIVLILMASYPLLLYFLKEYTVQIARNLAPEAVAKHSKERVSNAATVMVWLLVSGCSLITNNPFSVTNLVVSVVGTVVVFLMPVLCWMQIHGGFAHVFSLGLCAKKARNETGGLTKNVAVRVPSRSVTPAESERDIVEVGIEEEGKTTVLGMLAAQSVFWLSIAFIVMGLLITGLEMTMGDLKWRCTVSDFMLKCQ